MNSLHTRERQHRRLLTLGIGGSVAAHGVVLGLSTLGPPASTASSGEPTVAQSEVTFELSAIQLVKVEEVQEVKIEPVDPVEMMLASAPVESVERTPVITAAEVETGGGKAPGASSVATPVASTEELVAQPLLAGVALSMRPNFAGQLRVAQGVQQSLLPADDEDHSEHDHAAGDGRGWLERLGIRSGRGGQCRPRPGGGVIVH